MPDATPLLEVADIETCYGLSHVRLILKIVLGLAIIP
jgi:hypothetical protein